MTTTATIAADLAYSPLLRRIIKWVLLPLIGLWFLMMILGIEPLMSSTYIPETQGMFGTSWIPGTQAKTLCNYWTGRGTYTRDLQSVGQCPLYIFRQQEQVELR